MGDLHGLHSSEPGDLPGLPPELSGAYEQVRELTTAAAKIQQQIRRIRDLVVKAGAAAVTAVGFCAAMLFLFYDRVYIDAKAAAEEAGQARDERIDQVQADATEDRRQFQSRLDAVEEDRERDRQALEELKEAVRDNGDKLDDVLLGRPRSGRSGR